MLCQKYKEKFPNVGSIHEDDEQFGLRYYLFGEGVILSAEQAILIRQPTADVIQYALAEENDAGYDENVEEQKRIVLIML